MPIPQIERERQKITNQLKKLEDTINSTQDWQDLIPMYNERKKLRAILQKIGKVKPKKLLKIMVLNGGTPVKSQKMYIGRNESANDLVYKKSCERWYHAVVHGGGLIGGINDHDPVVCSAWAIVHSKFLKTYGLSKGWVDSSANLVSCAKKGSFIFKDSQRVWGDASNAVIYFKKVESRIIASLDFESWDFAAYLTPLVKDEKYSCLKEKGYSNLNQLDRLVPLGWDIQIKKPSR